MKYGIIPRYYGPTLNDLEYVLAGNPEGQSKLVFPPSQFAMAAFALTDDKKGFLKETLPEIPYYTIEEAVKKRDGTYKILRKDPIRKIDASSEAVYANINTKRNSRICDSDGLRIPAVHLTTLKDMRIENNELGKSYTVHCGCSDFGYARGRQETRRFSVSCRHLAIALTEQYRHMVGLQNKVKICKTPLSGEGFLPINLIDQSDIIANAIKMYYIDKKKLFDIDVEITKIDNNLDHILTADLQNLKNAAITYEVVKQKEGYPRSIGSRVFNTAKYLQSKGFDRNAIVLEDNGLCNWNFNRNNWNISLITNPKNETIDFLVYQIVGRTSKWHTNSFYRRMQRTIDPLTLKPRLSAIFTQNEFLKLERELQ